MSCGAETPKDASFRGPVCCQHLIRWRPPKVKCAAYFSNSPHQKGFLHFIKQKRAFLTIGGSEFKLRSEMHPRALLSRQKRARGETFAGLRWNVYHLEAHRSKRRLVGECFCNGNARGEACAFKSTPGHTARLRHHTALINLACVRLCKQSQVGPRHPKHWLLGNEGRGIASAGSLQAGGEAGKGPQPDGNMWPNYRAARQ